MGNIYIGIENETHQVFHFRNLPGPKGRALQSKVLKRLPFTVSKAMNFNNTFLVYYNQNFNARINYNF